MNTTKHDTRPTTDRIHADRVACLAARDARELDKLDVAQCASIYAAVYAAAMRGER